MGLDQSGGLILCQVPYDDQDRLIRQVFSGVELLDVRDRNFVERLFRAMGRPAIGMAVKNQLVEGLHGHIPGIIVIADDFAEDLRADPFEFPACGTQDVGACRPEAQSRGLHPS
jgi:hypothetical protein